MATQRIFASRTKVTASDYIGHKGMLFYDETTGVLRIGDGVTPGGNPIGVNANIVTTESIVPDADNVYGIGTEQLRWNHLHLGDGGIYFDGNGYPDPQTVPYLPGALVASLVPAPTDNSLSLGSSTHRWGDVWIGRASIHLLDETTNADVALTVSNGTMYLNNVQSLAVGQLTIVGTTLTSQTSNLDISIGATDDTGFFYVKRKAQFDNTSFSATEPMVSLNASGGTAPATIFPDTVMQTVGRPNKNSRIVQRAYGSTSTQGGNNSYTVWGSYTARGSIASPQALKQNDILMRISGNGYGVSTWGSGGARMEYVALEDFTDSAKGTKINFWTTPAGQLTSQNVASINSVGIVTASVEFSATGRVQTDAGIPITAKAISSATYVATLGIDGKLDTSQIPSALTGAVVFKGGWDATANTPSLSNGTGTDGYEYAITTGGTRSLGTQTGTVTYEAGGFVIYGSGIWNYTPPFNNITYVTATAGTHVRVNGNYSTQETGVITLTTDATPNATTSTIVSRDASGNFAANVITASLTGNVTGNVSGNAGSVSNGVYTTGDQIIGGTKTFTSTINGTITTATYATAFNTSTLVANAISATTATNAGYAYSFNTGTLVTNAVNAQVATTTTNFNTGTLITHAVSATTAGTVTTAAQPTITSVGTLTNLAIATSGTITTPRIVINDGGLRTVSGGTTCTIDFATDSIILWTAPSGTAAITLSNYTPGAQVKLIIAMTTSRDVTYGISSAANSSDGADNFNGSGIGSTSIANTAMHLEYTCISAVAGGCYVKVTVL
jgi:hypothetical protein